MKLSSVASVLFSAMLILSVAARAADVTEPVQTVAGDAPAAGGMPREHIKKEILKRFDKNGDGKLDDAERAAAKAAKDEAVAKFDKDGDGKLNEAERAEAKAAAKKHAKKKKAD